MKKKENVVTSLTVDVLGSVLPRAAGWEVEEQENVLDRSAKHPDIVVTRLGHETVAIDAKWQGAVHQGEANLKEVCAKYRGQTLTTDFRGKSAALTTVMVIRYPKTFRTLRRWELIEAVKAADDIEYVLVGLSKGADYRFPQQGFASGTLGDIANAIRFGAVPSARIQDAAGQMGDAVKSAARELHTVATERKAVAAGLNEILDGDCGEYGEQMARVGCLIIMGAFVFQNSLAGKQQLETVRPPAYYKANGIDLAEVARDWDAILKVNYHPIFNDARRMLDAALCYDEAKAETVLAELCNSACELIKSHLPQIHELAGEVFQTLLVDRKEVKANYTLPESATLISALACPSLPENATLETLPKVADYACGTGALLNGVYKRIQHLWEEQKSESSVDIHRYMLENNLAGCDVFSHCTHLTFSAMASAHPTVTLGATRVITAPFGKTKNGFKTGSLELLDNQLLAHNMEDLGKQASGSDIATAELKREFPNGEMDIVIMNPPYLTNSADNAAKNPKRVFGSEFRSKEEQELMLEELGKKPTEYGHGKVPYSYFVELAHHKLRENGRMAFILPVSIFNIPSFKKIRKMWATQYHNVKVVTISQYSGNDSAFSADTSLAECMIIADKGIGENTGRAMFVSLNERPDSLLTANALAAQIWNRVLTRRLEDTALGGDIFNVGSAKIANALDCPINEEEWEVARLKAMSLGQCVYHLRHGNLCLQGMSYAIPLPICPLGEVGKVGASDPDIKQPGRRGAFEMHENTDGRMREGYDTLYQVKKLTPQRSMKVVPDHKALIKPQNVEKAHRLLQEHNSRTHYHMFLRFNANSAVAHYTESPSIGCGSITNLKLTDPRYDAAWTLWTNSTLGLLCHWAVAGKQQSGRGKLNLTALEHVPTLDVRKLSDEQLDAAERVFADLKHARMLPYSECRWDAWRYVLDARILTEVLEITDSAVHDAMQTLRTMLSEEPSIAGDKDGYTDLVAEAKKHGYADDTASLATQQLALQMRGIELPDAAAEFEKAKAERKARATA